mmetsp:Transcript_7277/g.15950  ORF Transcript_7277/g.15950 Transcript_7277/m.15950 type:complete len:438 (-) Transcript_7277:153-1466(-)
MVDVEVKSSPASTPIEEFICSHLPPLDPNGKPFSMILRGEAAELAALRSALSASPRARQELESALQRKLVYEDDKFGDMVMENEQDRSESCEMSGMPVNEPVESGRNLVGGTSSVTKESQGGFDVGQRNKRVRDEARSIDDDENEHDDELEIHEHLLLYVRAVKCTCSSWEMQNVMGELLVTSIRVLFIGIHDQGSLASNDFSIDARCIALHAVDSLTSENGGGNETHVYCQISEPNSDEGDMAHPSAMSMISHTEILVDDRGEINDEQQIDQAHINDEDENSAVEVYFKPVNYDGDFKTNSGNQCDDCQALFDALTKLASLNPMEDGNEEGGGGLLSLMAMMSGMGGTNIQNGFSGGAEGFVFAGDRSDDDEMVVRFGGSNNLIENDDGSEEATAQARQAMLDRLDGMLTVPPEYEIPSSDDGGQFDDADDDDTLL